MNNYEKRIDHMTDGIVDRSRPRMSELYQSVLYADFARRIGKDPLYQNIESKIPIDVAEAKEHIDRLNQNLESRLSKSGLLGGRYRIEVGILGGCGINQVDTPDEMTKNFYEGEVYSGTVIGAGVKPFEIAYSRGVSEIRLLPSFEVVVGRVDGSPEDDELILRDRFQDETKNHPISPEDLDYDPVAFRSYEVLNLPIIEGIFTLHNDHGGQFGLDETYLWSGWAADEIGILEKKMQQNFMQGDLARILHNQSLEQVDESVQKEFYEIRVRAAKIANVLKSNGNTIISYRDHDWTSLTKDDKSFRPQGVSIKNPETLINYEKIAIDHNEDTGDYEFKHVFRKDSGNQILRVTVRPEDIFSVSRVYNLE